MCIELETFCGKWELRTGCLTAAFLGVIYSSMLSLFMWLGPHSSLMTSGWRQYVVIAVTVYNCIIVVLALCYAYAVLKQISWPLRAYKHMWNYLTISIAGVWFSQLIFMAVAHKKLYMASVAMALTTIFFTVFYAVGFFTMISLADVWDVNMALPIVAQRLHPGFNLYFAMILRSYQLSMSE